jgi:predicted phosphodiesterase
MKNFNYILVFGDNHDHWEVFPNFIRDYGLTNCAVIVAGDFGIGFQPFTEELDKLKFFSKRLAHTDSVLFAVRGNHDNPQYFTGEFDTNNIKLVPDYTVLNINNFNILCVGGAFSVDRTDRSSYVDFHKTKSGVIAKNNYWPNEVFVYDHDKVMSMKNINVVVTHTSPQFCPPYTKSNLGHWAAQDKEILKDCRIERAQLFQLYDNLFHNGNTISYWFYGHFHNSYKTPYLGTDFIGLDINEAFELK